MKLSSISYRKIESDTENTIKIIYYLYKFKICFTISRHNDNLPENYET